MSKKPYSKTPLTYEDQIKRLQVRGLSIANPIKAKHLLENISYYRLSGYWYPLLEDKKNHKFKAGATFNDAFNLYKFDRNLRSFMLREIEKIEVSIRAKMIYNLSQDYNPFWHCDANLFKDRGKFINTQEKLKTAFKRSDEEFIIEFRKNYSDPLPPSWMIFEIASFGTLSITFNNLKPSPCKRTIANYYDLPDSVFNSWIHSLVYLRNVCAHHTRLWNRTMRVSASLPRKRLTGWLENESVSNKKPFFVLSMIIFLMNKVNPDHTIQSRFQALVNSYPNIDLYAMGFPKGWEDEKLWKH